jgi:hypothetical protein
MKLKPAGSGENNKETGLINVPVVYCDYGFLL